MGKLFNKPIDNLPQSLLYLVLGIGFNLSIDNLPLNLISLEFDFGDWRYNSNEETEEEIQANTNFFSHSLDNLPKKILKLGYVFNKSVETIILHHKYPYSIHELPDSIKYIQIQNKDWFNYYYKNCTKPKSLVQPIDKILKKLKEIRLVDFNLIDIVFNDFSNLSQLNQKIINIFK